MTPAVPTAQHQERQGSWDPSWGIKNKKNIFKQKKGWEGIVTMNLL
jgi:hypothetical protein